MRAGRTSWSWARRAARAGGRTRSTPTRARCTSPTATPAAPPAAVRPLLATVASVAELQLTGADGWAWFCRAVFDLSKDPGEHNDLSASLPQVKQQLLADDGEAAWARFDWNAGQSVHMTVVSTEPHLSSSPPRAHVEVTVECTLRAKRIL